MSSNGIFLKLSSIVELHITCGTHVMRLGIAEVADSDDCVLGMHNDAVHIYDFYAAH